jgi:hypothetical protein
MTEKKTKSNKAGQKIQPYSISSRFSLSPDPLLASYPYKSPLISYLFSYLYLYRGDSFKYLCLHIVYIKAR